MSAHGGAPVEVLKDEGHPVDDLLFLRGAELDRSLAGTSSQELFGLTRGEGEENRAGKPIGPERVGSDGHFSAIPVAPVVKQHFRPA